MKLKLLLLSLYAFAAFTQVNQVDVNLRMGFSTNSLKINEPNKFTLYDFTNLSALNDKGILLIYKKKISSIYNIYISTGLDISQSKHYQKIINNTIHLGNIVLKKYRWSYRLVGIHKQFNIYNNKLIINLGVEYVNRFYFSSITNYNSEFQISLPLSNVEYSYNLTTYHNNKVQKGHGISKKRFLHLSPDFSIQLKFKLTNILYFNTGLNYSIKHVFYYDYNYVVKNHQGIPPEPVSTHTEYYHGYIDGTKFGASDNYLYLNFGLSYQFDKLKKH